ncbi:MAG: ClpX C4-type zinc finger protein [Clostridiales bacterium]|nr:ClpX C4-type zinc finger protein [Clostridiales bacterium]
MKKRRLAVVSMLLLVTLLSLSGCGKKQECEFCGKVKSGKTREVLGEKVFICNDCIDEMKNMFN